MNIRELAVSKLEEALRVNPKELHALLLLGLAHTSQASLILMRTFSFQINRLTDESTIRMVSLSDCTLYVRILRSFPNSVGGVNNCQTVRLSLALSSGEIPWFDVRREIQRCDWVEKFFLVCSHQNSRIWIFVRQITAPTGTYFSPYCTYIELRNFAKRHCERPWLTPPNSALS